MRELLEPLLAAGGGDAAQDFARPLPARVLLAFHDQPENDWASLKSWSEAAFLQFSDDPADQAAFRAANDALYEYGRALVAGRRSAPASTVVDRSIDQLLEYGHRAALRSASYGRVGSARS